MCIHQWKQTVPMQATIANLSRIPEILYRLVRHTKITIFTVRIRLGLRFYSRLERLRFNILIDYVVVYEELCNYHIWIGAVDITGNGNFQWIDGTPFQYTNWDSRNKHKFCNDNIYLFLFRWTELLLLRCIDESFGWWKMDNRKLYTCKLFCLWNVHITSRRLTVWSAFCLVSLISF